MHQPRTVSRGTRKTARETRALPPTTHAALLLMKHRLRRREANLRTPFLPMKNTSDEFNPRMSQIRPGSYTAARLV
jgi:hypothetical protein